MISFRGLRIYLYFSCKAITYIFSISVHFQQRPIWTFVYQHAFCQIHHGLCIILSHLQPSSVASGVQPCTVNNAVKMDLNKRDRDYPGDPNACPNKPSQKKQPKSSPKKTNEGLILSGNQSIVHHAISNTLDTPKITLWRLPCCRSLFRLTPSVS